MFLEYKNHIMTFIISTDVFVEVESLKYRIEEVTLCREPLECRMAFWEV